MVIHVYLRGGGTAMFSNEEDLNYEIFPGGTLRVTAAGRIKATFPNGGWDGVRVLKEEEK